MKLNNFKRWIIGYAVVAIIGATQVAAANGQLYQVSLLNGLMQGYYEGSVTVKDLLSHGNIGIGTFDALDGEMIVLDGVVYKAKANGQVLAQSLQEGVAFAAVANFQPSFVLASLPNNCGIEELKMALDNVIMRENGNLNEFYAVRIDGVFELAHVRSVEKQSKPYRPLAQVALDQKEYKYQNVKGTIVAIRCPNFVGGMNVAEWHFHFISDDRTKGGHLLDIAIKEGRALFDALNDWRIILPQTSRFAALDLAKDLGDETKRVESKQL